MNRAGDSASPVVDLMTHPRPIVMDELDREGSHVQISDVLADGSADTCLVEARPERHRVAAAAPRQVGSVRIGDAAGRGPAQGEGQADPAALPAGLRGRPRLAPRGRRRRAGADLWPALAESLVRLARTALGPGVLQGYRTVDESLRTVRGASGSATRSPDGPV